LASARWATIMSMIEFRSVLHLIAGLIIPDSRDILINDELVAMAKKDLREPERRGVGMVFRFDLTMKVGENIEFGLRAKRIPEHTRRHRIEEMVDLVRLGDYLNVRPRELSGGQQKRVALARP
jgi:ABC-type sugar transport system ATPase subunit